METERASNIPTGATTTLERDPDVFKYMDFKEFLKDFYEHKKVTKNGFSYASFAQKAKLQSPNYLKRVIDGDRSLNAELIPKFCVGLGLSAKQSIYFEALVNFNQSKDEEVKRHYFGILRKSSEDVPGSAMEIMGQQFEALNHWFILPVREMVLLKDFREDPAHIAAKLKNKIAKKDATFAIETLIKIGLLKRNKDTGRLEQTNPIVRYSQEVVNMAVREFHNQMLERTKQSLQEDQFGTWNVRALTLAVEKSQFQEVHQKITDFISELNKSYSKENDPDKKDLLVQINCQMIQLTETKEEIKFNKPMPNGKNQKEEENKK